MVELTDVKRFLHDSNPHWVSGKVGLPDKWALLYRPYFDQFNSRMERPQILALLGIRRVGKSVIMKQLMHHLNLP